MYVQYSDGAAACKLQISYGDSNPILSDRTKYPNFYRTVPSEADFNLARIRLLEHYGWTRVGTLFQDASSRSARHANVIISINNTATLSLRLSPRHPKPILLDLRPACWIRSAAIRPTVKYSCSFMVNCTKIRLGV